MAQWVAAICEAVPWAQWEDRWEGRWAAVLWAQDPTVLPALSVWVDHPEDSPWGRPLPGVLQADPDSMAMGRGRLEDRGRVDRLEVQVHRASMALQRVHPELLLVLPKTVMV